jgi:hypothetical protein
MSLQPGDDGQAIATLKRLADLGARLVRSASGVQLEQVMRTPVRRVVLDGIFWQLPGQLDQRRIGGLEDAVRFRVTGRADGGTDAYLLELADGRWRVRRGQEALEPRLTITVDGAELVRLATGRSDPIRAYLNGKLALSGDVLLAVRLVTMLAVPELAGLTRRGQI